MKTTEWILLLKSHLMRHLPDDGQWRNDCLRQRQRRGVFTAGAVVKVHAVVTVVVEEYLGELLDKQSLK